jgi:hypothetical protein
MKVRYELNEEDVKEIILSAIQKREPGDLIINPKVKFEVAKRVDSNNRSYGHIVSCEVEFEKESK